MVVRKSRDDEHDEWSDANFSDEVGSDTRSITSGTSSGKEDTDKLEEVEPDKEDSAGRKKNG